METKDLWKEFKRFFIGGGVGVAIYYVALYTLTTFFGVYYVTSSRIGVVLNYGINFLVQKFWTFSSRDSKLNPKELVPYIGMALATYWANPRLLHYVVERWHIHYLVAQLIITIFVLTPPSFVLTRWIFKKK